MGLLTSIIEDAVGTAVKTTIVTGAVAALEVAAATVDATSKAVQAVGKGYKKVEPGLKNATNSVKNAVGTVVDRQRSLSEEKNIKNTFKGKKKGAQYLINCINKDSKADVLRFEVYNNDMQLVCPAFGSKQFLSVTVSVVDDDGMKLIEVSRKGLKNNIYYINDLLVSADSSIVSKIKTFDTSTNIVTGTATYKLEDQTIGYSYRRKEYVGGQHLLDVMNAEYLIPLIIHEIDRETKEYR